MVTNMKTMTKASDNAIVAANNAAQLIKQTAEDTATALNIQYMQKDIADIKISVKDLANKDAVYAQKSDIENLGKRCDGFVANSEFTFWRNVLISGILLTIFLGVIVQIFVK